MISQGSITGINGVKGAKELSVLVLIMVCEPTLTEIKNQI